MWVAELDDFSMYFFQALQENCEPRSGSVSPKEFVAGLKKMKGQDTVA